MSSYEKNISENKTKEERINISTLRYFWLANPLNSSRKDNIPKFLRSIKVLKNFTDNELRILCQFMHRRSFGDREVIFKQNDVGVGFYFIISGNVDLFINNQDSETEIRDEQKTSHIITLEKYDYFGELALLQEHSVRNASSVARESCELLGIFKPDVDELIQNHPIVAAKLLQSVSQIIANRFYALSREMRDLKYKLTTMDS